MALNKQDELYKASLPAFFTNEIETDKNILTLSVGAIGFYAAILVGKNFVLSEVMFISMIMSVFLYGITAAMVLGVFFQNKKQLLAIITNDGEAEENPHLTFLDKWKYLPFISAIVTSVVFILALTYSNINQKDNQMSEKKIIKGVSAQDGISGIVKASQSNILEKGFSGAATANGGGKGNTPNQESVVPATPPIKK